MKTLLHQLMDAREHHRAKMQLYADGFRAELLLRVEAGAKPAALARELGISRQRVEQQLAFAQRRNGRCVTP